MGNWIFSEWDICLAAMAMIQRHSSNAGIEAAERDSRPSRMSDIEGRSVWFAVPAENSAVAKF
jgi:hypothetical protein